MAAGFVPRRVYCSVSASLASSLTIPRLRVYGLGKPDKLRQRPGAFNKYRGFSPKSRKALDGQPNTLAHRWFESSFGGYERQTVRYIIRNENNGKHGISDGDTPEVALEALYNRLHWPGSPGSVWYTVILEGGTADNGILVKVRSAKSLVFRRIGE